MKRMKLYHSPNTSSVACLIALHHAGIPFESVLVDLANKGNYSTINPKGKVPALQLEDGTVITEAPAILHYIADLAPESGLVPPAGRNRYRVIELLNFVSSEMHQPMGTLFDKGAKDEVKAAARETLSVCFGHIEQVLYGRNFLTGNEFTAADALLFAIMGGAEYAGFRMSDWPHLKGFVGRCAQHESVLEAQNVGMAEAA